MPSESQPPAHRRSGSSSGSRGPSKSQGQGAPGGRRPKSAQQRGNQSRQRNAGQRSTSAHTSRIRDNAGSSTGNNLGQVRKVGPDQFVVVDSIKSSKPPKAPQSSEPV